MPTVGMQPSLRNTQAVGAALLHQFARERFLEAGVDENLIREAETIEHVDYLATSLLQEEGQEDSLVDEHEKSSSNNNHNSNGDSSQTDVASIRETSSWSDISTVTSSQEDDTTTITQDNSRNQFYSIAESSNVTTTNDETIYHSINRGRTVTTNLDRLQSTPLAVRYGRELKKIAEEFEKSRERQFIRQEAEKVSSFIRTIFVLTTLLVLSSPNVNILLIFYHILHLQHLKQVALGSITREAFTQLLEELFQGGITREKIVVIFLFSTDVALRAASFAQELVVKLLGWSFSYIINTVCKLVYELGGWEKLLCYQLPSLLISCCAILGILVLGFHLNRSLKWSSS